MPDDEKAHAALGAMFDALVSMIAGSRLEDDAESLLWPAVNIFHAASTRLQRRLDDNERAQRQSQIEQDGSEIRSVDLERLIAMAEDLSEGMRPISVSAIKPPHCSPRTPDRAGDPVAGQ